MIKNKNRNQNNILNQIHNNIFNQSNDNFKQSNNNLKKSIINVRVIRRGSGITKDEQISIINCVMNLYQSKIEPISNNIARSVKRTIGGNWLVVVYQEGKPFDFNMTFVKGDDYFYFILDNWAFQICRYK